MTVYVYRNGQLVEKATAHMQKFAENANLAKPAVSRFESFDSPVTGQPISSWRQRERDMNAVDAVDRRDIPQSAFENRKRIEARNGRAEQS